MTNALAAMAAIQQATIAARAATGMNGLGTRTRGGLLQVVLVTDRKAGRPIVDPLSDFLPVDQAIDVLRQIEADKGFH